MMLTWLADACRDTGYPTIEVTGWRTRGHGGMTAAHGVVGHWTAGPSEGATSSNTPSLAVVRDGRPGLDGPLCNVYTAFDGTLYVVAAGKAYHAGVSDWQGETDLNNTYAGNEVESPGNFDYTAAQLDVTPRLHAAILRRMGRGAQFSCAHFECADPPGRKPDGPARNMAGFRQQVAVYLANPTTIRKQEDDDMPYTEAQLTKIVRDAVQAELTTIGDESRTAIMDLAQRGASDATSSIRATLQAVRNDQTVSGDVEKKTIADLEAILAHLEPAPGP